MSRARAFPLVLLIWAAIYLPRVGSLEINVRFFKFAPANEGLAATHVDSSETGA